MTQPAVSGNKTVRVLHITDPHLFADPAGELRGVTTRASLERVLKHYRQHDWTADIVVATGDLVQDDSVEAYRHFAHLVGGLELPVLVVPGNHDLPEHLAEVLHPPRFSVNEAYESNAWMIVGIDTCVPGRAGGAVTDAELDRLDALLKSSGADHVLVCMHHPPVSMGSRWLDSVGMDDGDAVLATLAASGTVRVALFGHVHQAYDVEHAGIRVIGTPSTCRQFLPGSDDFAVDDRPPAYRQIELAADGGFDTHLVWL